MMGQKKTWCLGVGGQARPGRHATASDHAASIVKSVRRITRAVDLRSKEVSRTVGLTIPQLVILRAIEALGDVTVNALSAHADLSAATVVTILANLEERGLVERVRSSDDRRVVFARLTPRGRRMLRIAPPLLHDRFLEGFARLGRRRQRELAAALLEVAELLSWPADVRPVSPHEPPILSKQGRPPPSASGSAAAARRV